MTKIIHSKYSDRGFAKISHISKSFEETIERILHERLGEVYEIEKSRGDLWIRSKERRAAKYMDYAEEMALVDSANYADCTWIQEVEDFYNRFSDSYSDTPRAYDLCRSANERPFKNQVYLYSLALLLVKSSDRRLFLETIFFPWFFRLFPTGLVLATKMNSSYESRAALLRWGFLGTIYGSSELDAIKKYIGPNIKIMTGIHEIGTVNADIHFKAISNLFFPRTAPIVLSREGFMFILFTDQDDVMDRGPYPHADVDTYRVFGLMTGNEPNWSRASSPLNGWLGRYIPSRTFSAREMVDLFRFFIPKFNHFLRMRLDITNYRKGDDIDFIAAFEEYYTLDRIGHELNLCQTAQEGFTARTLTFAILDKFAEMFSVNGINRDRMFHYFLTRNFAKSLVDTLSEVPSPFGAFFSSETEEVFDLLYKSVLGENGLWMKYRSISAGISSREWDKNSGSFHDRAFPYSDEEFVGEVVRAVRNTHHGYISDRDDRRRFAVFMSMHTGKLADSLTALPQFMWLAGLLDPENTILTSCFPDKALQSVDY